MIDQCIYEVYKRDERVIIPNFGAIIYSDYSDEHDFNNLLNFDDGKVVAVIMKKKSLSEEEASAALEEYVKDMSDKIEQGKSVSIKGIGHFIKDDQGNIIIDKTMSSSGSKPKNMPKEVVAPVDEVVESEKEEPKEVQSTPFDDLVKNKEPEIEEEPEEEKQEQPVAGEIITQIEEQPFEPVSEEEYKEEETISQVQEEGINEEERKAEEINARIPDEENADEEVIAEEKDKYDLLLEEEGHFGNTFIHGEELSMEEENQEFVDESVDDEYNSKRSMAWDEEPKKGNTLKAILLILLPILLVSAGAYYYFNYYDKGDGERQIVYQQPIAKASTPKTSEIKEVPKSEDAIDSSKSAVVEKPASAKVLSSSSNQSSNLSSVKREMDEKTRQINKSPTGGDKSYSLILGSFKIENNADNYQKRLQSQGMNVVKFQGRYNYYFVGFDNIGNKTEAIRQLERIKTENPTAWIINRELIRD